MIKAMANALPVIASRSVGLPEYLGPEGIFVEGDDPADLAEKMLGLFQDFSRSGMTGRHLSEKASRLFGWDR